MKAQVVSFHCVMKDSLGRIISSSFNQDVITELPSSQTETTDQNLRGLIQALRDVRTGEKKKISVSAREAYGLYDPKLLIVLKRSDLPKGQRFRLGTEVVMEGRSYRIVETDANTVTLDGNHSLAGQDLHIDLEIVEAREAEADDFDRPSSPPDSIYLH